MVISISWSSPDVQYLHQHLHEWEQRPFTGTLLHLYKWPYAEAGCVEMGSGNGLSWSAFQKHRFTDEMFEETIRLLKATPAVRRNDILLWIVSYLQDAPRYFDWFDDERWQTILHNVEGLARVSREGGLKGIVLDCEEYGCPFWSWGGSRPDYALRDVERYKDKTWEQTAALVRRRGQSLIKAINRGYPGCLVWTTYGYSHIEMPDETTNLSKANNGLYARFLDGMLEASDDETIFVDGCEGAYRYSEPQEFMGLRRVVKEKALKYTLVPKIYSRKMRVGFGLYMDMFNYGGYHPWYADRPDDNFMTPSRLERAVSNAIKHSDGYVWIYSEYPSWWLDMPEAGFPDGLVGRYKHYRAIPRVYWRAVANAIANSKTGEALGEQ